MEYRSDIVSASDIESAEYAIFAIDRQEVQQMSFTRLNRQMKELKEAGPAACNKLFLTFNGYDYEPREIYEIPEIRKYVANLYAMYPYLFYFLSLEQGLQTIFFCCLTTVLPNVEKSNRTARPQVEIKWDKVEHIDAHTKKYAESVNDKKTPILLKDVLTGNIPHMPQEPAESSLSPLELFESMASGAWNMLTDSMQIKMVSKEQLLQFVQDHRPLISRSYEMKCHLLFELTGENVIYNLFAVNDPDLTSCSCGSNEYLIYKPKLIPDDYQRVVWLPSCESYMDQKISVGSFDFLQRLPIPIEIPQDLEIKEFAVCAKCGAIHAFHYDQNLGLSME